jgi:hypothetical protein
MSPHARSIDGDEENKVQEKALELAIDNGNESPEVDEYLEKNRLKEEEMDFLEYGYVKSNPSDFMKSKSQKKTKR